MRMPGSINYPPILSLLSGARLAAVPVLFGLQSDMEKYGFCIWQQHAAASLYPLVQQLELVLRNAIDSTARLRFGDHWWNQIGCDATKDNAAVFRDNIRKAEKKLKRAWRKAEAARQGLDDPSLVTTVPPPMGHDDIIAATDFHTWEAILVDAWSTDKKGEKASYLWPLSLTKVFRRLDTIDRNPKDARRKLVNMINELREYRNRLFHHDCIWIKSRTTDARTAIDSIREKINLLEKVLYAISPATVAALKKWGVFENARRICSVQELDIYINLSYPRALAEDLPVFNRYLNTAQGGWSSTTFMLEDKACILYRMR
jgi:hypothetical protein